MVMSVLVGAFWVCLHRPSDDWCSRSRPNRLCWPFRLHGPITEKTTISNLNIMHFSCIVSLCYKNLCRHVRQYTTLLFYINLLSEQQCAQGNIITNRTVYCLMNVCSCFLMVLRFYDFSAITHSRRRWGVVIVWQVVTLPMSCYTVQKITTRSMPQINAVYLSTSQSLAALWCYVSREFRFCCSNLW